MHINVKEILNNVYVCACMYEYKNTQTHSYID